MEDKRFAPLKTDPKFRRIPKSARKIKIDKRFQSMFKDKKFKVKYTTDKRGRPVNHTSTEDLKRYYELSSSSSEEEEDEVEEKSELSVKDKSDKNLNDAVKKKLRDLNVDYARGESTLFSESSSDDCESSENEEEEEEIEHKWGELDNDAEETEEVTYRLAACNMDWDRIRAVDLMVLLSSFLPPGGAVKSVTIYPSEFGKKRMKEEEIKGPIELVEDKLEEEEEDNEEGSKYHMEKLRQYQLNRLKYYYAVIVCDNANSANKIYTECDGMEYESSATKMDLRFIPDDMTFDDEIKDQCSQFPEKDKYQPRFFTTTALQQAKVDLTWDETDPDRIELTQKLTNGKIDEISEVDLQNYVAVSDEESEENEEKDEKEEDDEDPITKYKDLLQEIENKEEEKKKREIEMEVTWGIDLKEKADKLVKKKIEEVEEKTPFQKYLDKRKEKRKEKKKMKKGEDDDDDFPSDIDINDPYFAEELNNPEFKKKKKVEKNEENIEDNNAELELLLDESEDKSHFSLKKIQKMEEDSKKKRKKRKNDEEKPKDDFAINVKDERFSALFTSHLYNIDPTSPHYKKTKAMETLIHEKIKRRNDEEETQECKKVKKNAELNVLVKSVKRNTEALKNKKK